MRRTIILTGATLVLVSGLFVASLGASPAAQAMSWLDSMVTMNHGHHAGHDRHHGDHGSYGTHHNGQHMHQGQHCEDENGNMSHRHNGSDMHRGMMGQMHGQMHRMMDNHHADCPHIDQDDTQ